MRDESEGTKEPASSRPVKNNRLGQALSPNRVSCCARTCLVQILGGSSSKHTAGGCSYDGDNDSSLVYGCELDAMMILLIRFRIRVKFVF